ncbi:MAG: cytochrome c oxidase accessory protein CcoG [Rubripirellula sp.]
MPEITPSSNDALLDAPEHVLSTLEKDGSRRWLQPKLSKGSLWHKRRIVAYILMVVFVAIPHLRLAGKPILLLDIAAREFTILGKTFLPTDTLLLALLMLTVFVSVILVTAIAGRAWCGWGCPQTVYMEFLFRPIDRLFHGTVGKGGKPLGEIAAWKRLARIVVYLLLCMFLAHTFLAYFVGTERLSHWVRSSPIEHPTAFLVMAGTTALMMFDFLFFREQMCTLACPYGRFQSVMLDEQSLIVAYDPVRGEPRKKGKHTEGDNAGDCVDCNRCVVVCPTGIDIREGLQMECINCTQCIDACNSVMDRVGSPRGLIRYGSQESIARKPRKLLRARTVAYPLILLVVGGGLLFAISTKSGFDARVIRGKGAPFTVESQSRVTNTFKIRLVNRTKQSQSYAFVVVDPVEASIEIIDDQGLRLDPRETSLVPVNVHFPATVTRTVGSSEISIEITDSSDNKQLVDFRILGPR